MLTDLTVSIAVMPLGLRDGAVAALCSNFPVTRTIVGKPRFDALAVEYALTFPPDGSLLQVYGGSFPAWLNGDELDNRLPALISDVARCDRLVIEARHATHSPVLSLSTFEALNSETQGQVRLKLHPATRFAWYSTPAMQLWLDERNSLVGDRDLERKHGGALFTRPARAVEAIAIDAAGHRLLAGMRVGETVDQTVHAAAALYPDADAFSCLAQLVERGAFADVARCHHA